MTVYSVSNSTQFNAALGKAVGGDTIQLAAGNYGSAYIYNKSFSSAVTIKTTASAHFDSMLVSGSSNLRFEGLDVGHTLAPTEPEYTQLMRVQDSTGIQMVNMSIHGSLDNSPANDGMGLYVTNCSNVQLTGTSFRELFLGAYFEKNTNVTVASNNFQMIRSDGLDIGAVTNITIDKNYFTNFRPAAGDHPDAIQFWQVNQTTGSSNITITNNVVMQGAGVGTQGIFISDPNTIGYSNVLIQNNLLYGNDQYHGISVAGGHGVQILNNTVLSKSTDSKTYWIQLVGGDNFVVKDNLTDKILWQPGATGTLNHNLDLSQNASAKSLIPNLNAPLSLNDLIIAGYGYHTPGTATGTGTGTGGGTGTSGSSAPPPGATSTLPSLDGSGTTTIPAAKTTATTILPPTPGDATVSSTSVTGTVSSLSLTSANSDPVMSSHGPRFHHYFDHFTAIA